MNCENGCINQGQHLLTCDKNCRGCAPTLTDPAMRICNKCINLFDTKLVALATYTIQLQNNLVKSVPVGIVERISKSFNHGTGLNLGSSELSSNIREWLIFVYRIIITEITVVSPPVDTRDITLIRFIRQYVLWLSSHELATALMIDLNEFGIKAQAVIDPPRFVKVKMPNRTCTQLDNNQTCGAALTAVIRDGQTRVVCKQNRNHTQTITDWMAKVGDIETLVDTR
jgi:hypothetical protein